MNHGIIIGTKINENKYKEIIKKLLNKEQLNEEDKEFLKKKDVLN